MGGGAKCAKWANNPNAKRISKNGQKIMKKTFQVPDFCAEISATTFHPTHYGKKMKKLPIGVPKVQKAV